MPLAQTKLYTEADYYNLPEDVRAELIEGNLIYNHAAPSRIHQTILMELSGTIREYIRSKGDPCRGCTGAPDWIIEIVSPGNSSHDYVLKLNLYANAGVREYWIVDPRKERIFVYHLEIDFASLDL
ncbi:MAG: Uma2 family endonuclease [Blautia sp.]|nr:Uma2 family endonuclease [Blautia sp.]MDY4000561.1 Uma2 family endonuclease [Blautia sp.]